ncbi:hypothetical protein [Lutibaculum baratangense]|uniref:4,5-dihydroxyphthalate decarboxylase n=1 Tax=Lutibaculum baratangense AMV1 TaxID=631454 RepID=V4R0R3_9HYPH|nr:hypothetical protein [Lutibaculum baratangense]ESR25587.1 hypothetical protein N177_1699 [Lutibaculum baratangense AMV1]
MSRASIVLGQTAIAKAFLERSAGPLDLDVREVKPVHRAFRPMVEEAAYDVSEVAIVTAIQAADHGRPVIALPIAIAARLQHRSLVQNSLFSALGPADLRGRRVGVRAYSQTTGTWVRTILETEYGVMSRDIEWVTQEAPHVSGAPEPANVVRDPAGASPLDLLREGKVDAAIFGNDMPKDDWVRPVIPDPEATARASLERTGVVQINHVVSVSRDLAERDPDLVRELWHGFAEAKAALPGDGPDLLPRGEDMRHSVETLLGSVHNQGLTTRRLSFDDVFGEGCRLVG